MTDHIQAYNLLKHLAMFAPAPLPSAAITMLLDGAAAQPRAELLSALVSRTDIDEQQALALTVAHRTCGLERVFLGRRGVSDAAVEQLLGRDRRVNLWRALAGRSNLSPRAYELLAASTDLAVRTSLLTNSASTAELAVRLWTSPEPLTDAGKASDLRQLHRKVLSASFGMLKADALHALLQASLAQQVADPARWFPTVRATSSELLHVWHRLGPHTRQLLVRTLLAHVADVDPAAPADLVLVKRLVQRCHPEQDLLALVQTALPDPGSPLGAAARPEGLLPLTFAWAEAVPDRFGQHERAQQTWAGGLSAAVVATCGDDPARWQVLAALNPDFSGTAQDMLDVIAGVTS